jgi:hypothetical protein
MPCAYETKALSIREPSEKLIDERLMLGRVTVIMAALSYRQRHVRDTEGIVPHKLT